MKLACSSIVQLTVGAQLRLNHEYIKQRGEEDSLWFPRYAAIQFEQLL